MPCLISAVAVLFHGVMLARPYCLLLLFHNTPLILDHVTKKPSTKMWFKRNDPTRLMNNDLEGKLTLFIALSSRLDGWLGQRTMSDIPSCEIMPSSRTLNAVKMQFSDQLEHASYAKSMHPVMARTSLPWGTLHTGLIMLLLLECNLRNSILTCITM